MGRIGKFAQDRGGNFGMMVAIGALPLLLAGGIAIDFTSLSRERAELQQALDSAALAIAREGNKVSDEQAIDIASVFLAGNFARGSVDLEVKRDGTAVTVDGKVRVPLAFSGLVGYETWPVAASASADIAYTSYEIVLVLDTTGSMKGGKLQSMKDAVDGLVTSMSGQVKDPKRLKFGIVPFANFVNVGPQYGPKFDADGNVIPGTGAKWLDVEGKTPIPQLELGNVNRFRLFKHLGQQWSGCVETRMAVGKKKHDHADTPADPSDPASLFVPAFHIDEPDRGGYANSYIVSAVSPLDKSPAAAAAKLQKYGVRGDGRWVAPRTDFSNGKGPNQACVTQPIMALNSNYKDIVAKVKTLQANGTTNIMEGVAWGTRVLSPGEPFDGGADARSGVEKIMVVLTDGANVFGNAHTELGSTYASRGYLVDGRLGVTSGSAWQTNALMNTQTLEACKSAKAAGITVFTIRLEEPDVATGTMLKDCATSEAHYFDAPSRAQLDEVFRSINDKIVRIRIAS